MTITKENINEVLELCEHHDIELVAIKSGCKYWDVAFVTTWNSGKYRGYRIGFYDYGKELPQVVAYERELKDALVSFYSCG